MSSNFEWKTEEDEQWEEPAPHIPPKQPRKRPWPILILIFCLVLAAGTVLQQQVSQEVEATLQEVEDGILSTHQLIWRTAQNQDEELFKSLISGANPQWSATQINLMAAGDFGNPPLLGWQAERAALSTTDDVTITLSAELAAAELQMVRFYTATNPAGDSERIRLLETAVYRQGTNRWLLAAPTKEFWGEWQTQKGEFVTVAYPERDREMAQRLLADLDQLVADICTEVAGLACPADLHVFLRLDDDIKGILVSRKGADVFNPALTLQLPTPSLLGLPLDETSYEALYRMYGEKVATAVITNLLGYDCCIHAKLYQGLLDRQLAQLGLKPWVLTKADYAALFNRSQDARFNTLFGSTLIQNAEHRAMTYAFVEYLEQNLKPEVPLIALQRSLVEDVDVSALIQNLVMDSSGQTYSDSAFLKFIYEQSTAGQKTPVPPALAHKQVQLVCNQFESGRVAIYQLDLETEQWQEAFQFTHAANQRAFIQKIFGRANSYYMLFTDATNAESMSVINEVVAIEDNEVLFILDYETEGRSPYIYAPDHENYLILRDWQPDGSDSQNFLINIEQCQAGNCQPQPLEQAIVWSPDGQRTLHYPGGYSWDELAQSNDWPAIYLGDANGRQPVAVGQGILPFWLDARTFAYLALNAAGQMQVETITVDSGQRRILLTAADLLAAIPPSERPEVLPLIWVTPHQAASGEVQGLFVTAQASVTNLNQEGQRFSFEVDLLPDFTAVTAVSHLATTPRDVFVSLSSDREWLIFNNYSGSGNRFSIVNRESGEEQVVSEATQTSGLDWSADGDWYVLNQEHYLLIGSLSTGYQNIYFHELDDCRQAYWLEAE